MAEKILWTDRQVERELTFFVENNEDGSITLRPNFGEIIEEGTPLNAVNMASIYDYVDAKVLEGGGKVVLRVLTQDPEVLADGEMWIRSDLL